MLLRSILWTFILYMFNLIFRRESIGHLCRLVEFFFRVNSLFPISIHTNINHSLLGILLSALRFGICLQGAYSYLLSRITVLYCPFSKIWKLFKYFFLIFYLLIMGGQMFSLLFCCWLKVKISHHYHFIWGVDKAGPTGNNLTGITAIY